MAKMKAVVMVGISGSGKSTKAREEYPGYEIVERDAIRRAMLKEKRETEHVDEVNMWSLWKFNKTNEEEVTRRFDIRLAACAAGKRNVVVADTNVSAKTRTSVVMKLKSHGYEVEVVDVECDLLTAFKRDERRRDTVGRDVIYDQYMKYLEFKGRKQYVPDTSKPKCILVDIDGTLAHMNGKRGAVATNVVGCIIARTHCGVYLALPIVVMRRFHHTMERMKTDEVQSRVGKKRVLVFVG